MLKEKNKTHARLAKKISKSKKQLAHSDGFISLTEAAGLCTYSQEYLSLLVRRKLLQGEKIGRNWFTKKEWLENYVAEHPSDKRGNVKGELLVEKVFKEKIVESKVNKNLNDLLKDFSVWLKNFLFNENKLTTPSPAVPPLPESSSGQALEKPASSADREGIITNLKNFFMGRKNLLIQTGTYNVDNLLSLFSNFWYQGKNKILVVIHQTIKNLPVFFVWKKLLPKQIFEKALVGVIIFSLLATTAGAEFFPENILKMTAFLEKAGRTSNRILFVSTDWADKKLGLGKIIESAAVASENFSATTSYVVRKITNGNASGSLTEMTERTGGQVAGASAFSKKSGQNFLALLSMAGEKISRKLTSPTPLLEKEGTITAPLRLIVGGPRLQKAGTITKPAPLIKDAGKIFNQAQQFFSQTKNLAYNFFGLPQDSEKILVKATENLNQTKILNWLQGLNKNSERFSRLAFQKSKAAAGATQLAAVEIFNITEKVSDFVWQNIFNPIANLGNWLGNSVVYVAKNFGIKIGEWDNSWLNRELALQDLIKNMAGRKDITVVKEFGSVREIVKEIQGGEKIIVLKGEKGDKGETGEKGEAGPSGRPGTSGAPGSSGNTAGGTTIINNVYNIAPGSQAKDGAGSAFAAKYIGASELSVSGETKLNTLSVSGNANFSGATIVSGNLQGGNVISAGYLKVGSGNNNWPLVSGNGYLAGNLEIDGSIKIDSATTTDPAVWIAVSPLTNTTDALLTLGSNKISSGSANGTFIAANPTTFAGDFINFQIGNVSKFKVDKDGNVITVGTASHSGTVLIEATTTPQLIVRYDTDHQWLAAVDNKGNLTFDLTSATNTPEISFLDPFNISTSTLVDVFNITASTTQNILDIKSSSTDYLVKFDQMGAGGIFELKSDEAQKFAFERDGRIAQTASSTFPLYNLVGSTTDYVLAVNQKGAGGFFNWQRNGASIFTLSNEGVLNLQNASSTNSIISVAASSTAPLAIFNQTGAGSIFRFDSAPVASSTIALLQMTASPMAAGSLAGTFIAANPQSFSGNFLDFQIAGTRYFSLASDGDIFSRGGILMAVNSTTALSIRDANDVTHFVIDTTRGHYGFATSSPADLYGLTIATSTLQYGDWYNYGNATSSGVFTANTQLKIATSTTDSNYKLGVGGAIYIAGNYYGQGSATTTGTQIVSGALGVATTTYAAVFNVAGSSYLSGNVYTQGSATTTGSSFVNIALGVATTTLGRTFNVAGSSYLAGDTYTQGNATTTGSVYIGNDLTVANSTVLGTSVANTLTVNNYVNSSLIPQSNTYNLGSTGNRWGTIYGDTINASNIVANNTEIGGTKATDFTINSDNASDDTEDMSVTFKRGLPVTNAVIAWDASENNFNFNFPIWIEGTDTGGAASSTITVKSGANQGTANLFQLQNSSSNTLVQAGPQGHFAIGPSYQNGYGLTIATTTYASGNFYLAANATTTGTQIVSTAFGVNTTTLPYTFNVSGTGYFTDGLRIAGYATTSNLTVQGKSTSTLALWVGSSGTANYLDLTGGDLYVQDDLEVDGSATTTLSHYIGGDLTVIGNYSLTGGASMNSATVTDTFVLGGYQKFTETGDNFIYFDNGITDYLKWNDTGDQFEFSNGLLFANATATDSFYASNIFITNGGNFNAVTTTDTAYIGGKLQVAGAPTSTIASSLAIDTNTLIVNANEGRVGIATLNPQQALDVTGNAQVSGRLSVGTTDNSLYALNVSGNSYLSGSATTTGTQIVSTAFGVNTTTLPYTFNVSGTGYFTDGVRIAGYATTSDIYNLGRATTTQQAYFGNTLRIAGTSQIFTGAASIITETNDLTIDAAGSLVIQDATDLNNTLDIDVSSASALTVGNGTVDTLTVDALNRKVAINDSTPDYTFSVTTSTDTVANDLRGFDLTTTRTTASTTIAVTDYGSNFSYTSSKPLTSNPVGALTDTYYGSYLSNLVNGTLTQSGNAITRNTYGLYATTTDAGAVVTGGTKNVYGVYANTKEQGTVAEVGTTNVYGLYSNVSATTTGASTAYGLYATATGADTNYAAYLQGNFYTSGSATTTGTQIVSAAFGVNTTTLPYAFNVTGNSYLADGLLVGGYATTSNLTVQGQATTTDYFYATNYLKIATTTSPYALNVTGAGYLTGNLIVGGTSIFSGGSSFNSVTTTDTAYIGGKLTVVGSSDLQGNVFDSLGDFTIDDNLSITGNATTTGYVSVGSAMAGFNYLNGYLNVQNGIFANSATTTDTLRVGGKLTAVNGLFATASTTIAANATTTGNFTAQDTLYVKDGNVGIGLQNPSQKLYVSGNTYLSGSATTTNSFYFPSGVIQESGNVGIGTTGPTKKLSIVGDAKIIGDDGWDGAGDLAILSFGSTVANEDFGIGYKHSTGMILNVYKLNGGGSFGTHTLDAVTILDTSGNVGIGTITPTSKLDVRGMVFASSTTEQLRIGNGTTADTNYASFTVLSAGDLIINPQGTATTTFVWSNLKVEGSATTTGSFYFPSGVIQESGNVGIGTTGPSYTLHVQASSTSPIIGTNNASSTDFLVRFNQEGAGGILQLLQNKDPKVTITNQGNVGIGTTGPMADLQIKTRTVLQQTSALDSIFSNNLYYDGANWKYITTAVGSMQMATNLGDYIFFTAPSGTAGNTATLSERMRILNTGNVGIGTTGPSGLLHISRASGGTETLFQVGTTTSDNLLVIKSTGNVGIGTTAPGYKLTVADSATNGRAIDISQTSTSGTVYGLVSQATGASTQNIGGYFYATGATTNRALYLDTTAATNNWNIYANGTAQNYFAGNVGIGTVSPTQKLDVRGMILASSTTEQLRIGNGTTADTNYASFTVLSAGDLIINPQGTATTTFVWSNLKVEGSATTTNSFYFPSGVIQESGNVGIGTTGPSSKLHVYGSNTSNVAVSIQNTDTGGKNWQLMSIGSSASVPVGSFSIYDGTSHRFVINNGNVGIGTVTPGARLDVATSDGFSGALFRVASTTTEGLYVGSSGNVGIGTTGPNRKLVAFSEGSTFIKIDAREGNDNGIEFASHYTGVDDVVKNAILIDNASSWYKGDMHFVLNNGDDTNDYTLGTDTRMVIKSTGNVGIGTTAPGAKLEVFKTTGNEGNIFQVSSTTVGDLLVVKNSGNVGIGTTGPGYKVDITGTKNTTLLALSTTFTAANDYTNLDFISKTPSAADTVFGRVQGFADPAGGGYAGGLSFWTGPGGSAGTASTEKVRIQYNGNVGIGTITPTSKLDVRGMVFASSTTEQLRIGNGTTADTNYASFTVLSAGDLIINPQGTATTTFVWSNLKVEGSATTTGSFYFPSGVIQESGNVGIGTTGPVTQLHVVGSARFYSDAANYTQISGRTFSANDNISFSNSIFMGAAAILGQSGSMIQMTNNNVFINGGKLYIESTGNVGIGTTAPARKLDINGSSIIYDQTATTGTSNLTIRAGAGQATGPTRLFDIFANDGTTARFHVTDVGNVGIGTTSPLAKLQIVGGNIAVDDGMGVVAKTIDGSDTDNIGIGGGGSIDHIRGAFFDLAGNEHPTRPGTAEIYAGNVSGGEIRLFTQGTQRLTVQYGGNVGIGTTNPSQKLSVVGQCITGDTLLSIRRRKRNKKLNKKEQNFDPLNSDGTLNNEDYDYLLTPIRDVLPGDQVLSLNEATNRAEYRKIRALMDMGVREIYELRTKSGRIIRTTENHPYLIKT